VAEARVGVAEAKVGVAEASGDGVRVAEARVGVAEAKVGVAEASGDGVRVAEARVGVAEAKVGVAEAKWEAAPQEQSDRLWTRVESAQRALETLRAAAPPHGEPLPAENPVIPSTSAPHYRLPPQVGVPPPGCGAGVCAHGGAWCCLVLVVCVSFHV
jgi:hypothetical protein